MRPFHPILAGGNLPDRLVACLGAALGIALTALISAAFLPGHGPGLLIAAPMGASAVLVFAVPASPLAQPWPVVGGNAISALVGIGVAAIVPDPAVAAGLAVGGAILAMSLTRSLHPPGGAVALIAVIGGPAVLAAGWRFAFVPVAVNAGVLAMLGIVFHRLSGHPYPHRPPVVGRAEPADFVRREDIDLALADLGETFDIDRADLDALVTRAEFHARRRGRAARR